MSYQRPTHLNHPGMPGHTLCGYSGGPGCRMTDGETVTCDACRAIVRWCREGVRIGFLQDDA